MTKEVIVSVIIPTYNRLSCLKTCLNSLFNQTLDKRLYEIIIVDDGSTDNTKKYIKKLQRIQKIKKICYYLQKNSGPAIARNLGVKHSKGRIIAFLDDDCVAHTDWLEKIIDSFNKYPDAAYIGGYVIPIHKQWFLRNVTKWKRKYSQLNKNTIERTNQLIYTDNSAIKKDIFLKIGGFSKKFRTAAGEDSDLSLKLLTRNYSVYTSGSMQVDHNQRDTVLSLFKRHYRFGKYAVTNYNDYYKGYVTIRLVGIPNIYFKSRFTLFFQRTFFKDILFVIVLSFFWPVIGLSFILIKILYMYFFQFKNIKATLSFCVYYLITESALFIGNILGSLKIGILHI